MFWSILPALTLAVCGWHYSLHKRWSSFSIVLKIFEHMTGRKINYSKSVLFGANKCHASIHQWALILGCKIGSWPLHYFGASIGSQPRKNSGHLSWRSSKASYEAGEEWIHLLQVGWSSLISFIQYSSILAKSIQNPLWSH